MGVVSFGGVVGFGDGDESVATAVLLDMPGSGVAVSGRGVVEPGFAVVEPG